MFLYEKWNAGALVAFGNVTMTIISADVMRNTNTNVLEIFDSGLLSSVLANEDKRPDSKTHAFQISR